MKIIDKALKLRKSFPLKSKKPWKAFLNRLDKPKTILFIVEKNTKSSALIYDARRQFVVSLVAAYEIYWRDFIKITIRYHKYRLHLENIRNIKFSLEELHQILGHKLTISELISAAYTFQSTEAVNRVARDIFNIDLFSLVAKAKYKISVQEITKRKNSQSSFKIVKGKDIMKEKTYIDKSFTIRHETVHDTGVRFRLNHKSIERMQNAMLFFNLTVALTLENELDRLKKLKPPIS